MIDLKNISAIIFDLGGVILNIDYQLTIDAFKKLGVSNFEEMYTQAAQSNLFDNYETGQISSEQFVYALKKFLPDEVSEQKIKEAWNVMLLDLTKSRVELLLKLRKIKPIFLFSNTNDIHYKCFLSEIEKVYGKEDLLEQIFVKTYYSHLVEVRKPNAAAFQLVLDENGLLAQETLFIDDSIQHINGAQELGIQTVHLKNQEITHLFNLDT